MNRRIVIPGTSEAVLAACDLRVQLRLRDELRMLREEADAMLTFVCMLALPSSELLEYAGDAEVTPRPLPVDVGTVPGFEIARFADGGDHQLVVHAVRIGRGWPKLALGVVDAGLPPPGLVGVMEERGAALEETLVSAVTRWEGRAARGPR